MDPLKRKKKLFLMKMFKLVQNQRVIIMEPQVAAPGFGLTFLFLSLPHARVGGCVGSTQSGRASLHTSTSSGGQVETTRVF